jgi:hypothetical protein
MTTEQQVWQPKAFNVHPLSFVVDCIARRDKMPRIGHRIQSISITSPSPWPVNHHGQSITMTLEPPHPSLERTHSWTHADGLLNGLSREDREFGPPRFDVFFLSGREVLPNGRLKEFYLKRPMRYFDEDKNKFRRSSEKVDREMDICRDAMSRPEHEPVIHLVSWHLKQCPSAQRAIPWQTVP